MKRIILILPFFLSGLVFAKEKHFGKGKELFKVEKLQKELNLDQEQMKKVQEINQEFQSKAEKIHQELKPLKDSLEQELEKDTVDKEKIRQYLQQIHAKKLDLHLLRIDHRLAIENVLNSEQKSKWKALVKKMWHKHKEEKD